MNTKNNIQFKSNVNPNATVIKKLNESEKAVLEQEGFNKGGFGRLEAQFARQAIEQRNRGSVLQPQQKPVIVKEQPVIKRQIEEQPKPIVVQQQRLVMNRDIEQEKNNNCTIALILILLIIGSYLLLNSQRN